MVSDDDELFRWKRMRVEEVLRVGIERVVGFFRMFLFFFLGFVGFGAEPFFFIKKE